MDDLTVIIDNRLGMSHLAGKLTLRSGFSGLAKENDEDLK
jgi:hypothetical protein